MKTEATKAYQIDLNRISEGFLYSPVFCHAKTKNEAKSELLKKVRYEGMELLYSKGDLSYLNIPVVRYKEADLIDFEGELMTQAQIDAINRKRERIKYFDSILNNPDVSHCYIRKHGSYYRPRACGYTSFRSFAGVYEKADAVSHGRTCDELQIIPIDTLEHNQMIQDEIADFKTRLISPPQE